MEYFPSKSVAVPIVVPGTEIVAPGIGCPLSSNTVPVTLMSNTCFAVGEFSFGKPSKAIALALTIIRMKKINNQRWEYRLKFLNRYFVIFKIV